MELKAQELEEEYQKLQLEIAQRKEATASVNSDSSQANGGDHPPPPSYPGYTHENDEAEEESSADFKSNEGQLK